MTKISNYHGNTISEDVLDNQCVTDASNRPFIDLSYKEVMVSTVKIRIPILK